jgi:Swiss Army Knife RNA repair-like protein
VRAKGKLTTSETTARQAGEPAGERRSPAPAATRRALLLVDIDGVISLFAFADERRRPPGSFHWIDGMPHFLSATAAEHLLALAERFELAWASGWEERANEHLPHLLGVPRLPHLRFERAVGRANAHWKLDAIEAHAGERPLAWIDDAFNDACHAWAAERAAPTLLVQTSPASGITAREVAVLLDWERSLAAR